MPTRGKTRLRRKLRRGLCAQHSFSLLAIWLLNWPPQPSKKSQPLWPKAGLRLPKRLLDMASDFEGSSARGLKAALARVTQAMVPPLHIKDICRPLKTLDLNMLCPFSQARLGLCL